MNDLYKKEGQANGAVGAIITLIVGVGVAVLVLIFVGALGGQTYNLVQEDIASINDSDIKANVDNSIKAGFEALEQTGNYIPIIVLAVVISIVLFLVLSMMNVGTGGAGRGSAL
jgi:hypothetical protein